MLWLGNWRKRMGRLKEKGHDINALGIKSSQFSPYVVTGSRRLLLKKCQNWSWSESKKVSASVTEKMYRVHLRRSWGRTRNMNCKTLLWEEENSRWIETFWEFVNPSNYALREYPQTLLLHASLPTFCQMKWKIMHYTIELTLLFHTHGLHQHSWDHSIPWPSPASAVPLTKGRWKSKAKQRRNWLGLNGKPRSNKTDLLEVSKPNPF